MDQLLNEFNKLPSLDFSDDTQCPEQYEFPGLAVNEALRDRVSERRREWSQDRLTAPSPNDVVGEASGISLLRETLSEGLKKFRYGTSSAVEWNEFMRFSSDRLAVDKVNKSCEIVGSSDGEWDATKEINRSREVAESWFFETLLPDLKIDGNAHATYILGDPGCGKSTLFKFLLCYHQTKYLEAGVRFSRFEFLKFKRGWFDPADPQSSLIDYISFIHLRDLVTYHFFDTRTPGSRTLQWAYQGDEEVAAARIRTQCEKIAEAVEVELHKLGFSGPRSVQEYLFTAIWNGREQTKEFHRGLKDIPLKMRMALNKVLLENARIVTVFDGLDCINVADLLRDTETTELIRYILKNRIRLCDYNNFQQARVPFSTASLVIMRHNSLAYIENKDRNLRDLRTKPYYVGLIDPRAAFFNVVSKSVERARSRGISLTNDDEIEFSLFQSIERTLSAIPRAGTSTDEVYDLFCGNFREIIEFVIVLFGWIVGELSRDERLPNSVRINPSDLLQIITSKDTHALLRRRNYRMIELLLFSELAWFENANTVDPDDLFGGPTTAGNIAVNDAYSGFVDNVFNYHVEAHVADPAKHCLLEKIRILQLLQRRPLSRNQIQDELKKLFGYESVDLMPSIIILLRGQIITAEVNRQGRREFKFVLTGKGKFALKVLISNMAYLEHVFHKTLFPKRLLRSREDRPRSRDSDEWTIRSICNVFTFLAYIEFVETYPAGGKTVPDEFKIAGKVRDRVVRAVRRILRSEEREIDRKILAGESDVERFFLEESLKEIKGLKNLWRLQGLFPSYSSAPQESL